jgi:hypothetical protein
LKNVASFATLRKTGSEKQPIATNFWRTFRLLATAECGAFLKTDGALYSKCACAAMLRALMRPRRCGRLD